MANTLTAVDAGVTHVQGTANGYGERAGNANLFSVVAGLQLKKGRPVLPETGFQRDDPDRARDQRGHQRRAEHPPALRRAVSAFAHKAGLHASAIKVDPMLYQHIDPALVGNDMRMLVSDMAGRASVELKGRELGYDLSGDKAAIGRVTDRVKELEARGYTFEAADASLRAAAARRAPGASAASTSPSSPGGSSSSGTQDRRMTSEATVKLDGQGRAAGRGRRGQRPGERAGQGAARGAGADLPGARPLELTDYKVRILDGTHGTGAVTRVLIDSDDGAGQSWSTVGVDENIIAASWHALEEAVTYCLLRSGRVPG